MAPSATIDAVLVRPLAAALPARALPAFFESTDLTPQLLAAPEARVSPTQLCVAWAEAMRLSGDPALALRIARATPPGAFGIVEYVCKSAPTLREALRQWVRYLGILDDSVEVGLVPLGPQGALRVLAESVAPAPGAHELCFALIHQRARELLPGTFRIAQVRFSHRAAAAVQVQHRAFFGCPVRFGAAHTELVFDAAVLDAPLTSADPNLLAILLPAAAREAQRGKPSADALFTEQVRRALRQALRDGEVGLEPVARGLGLTGRSLQRRLAAEGTAFAPLRDETRRGLADQYIAQGLSISEVSFLLGFSEPSAFFRAFKRWTGLTPFERREALAR